MFLFSKKLISLFSFESRTSKLETSNHKGDDKKKSIVEQLTQKQISSQKG